MHVVRLQIEVIINFVDNDGQSEPWKSFQIFVYVRTAEGTTSDSLVYVFGCCVFCRGGDDGRQLDGWKILRKKSIDNLSIDGVYVPGMPAGAVRTLTGRLACRCQNTSLSCVTKWRLSSSSSCRYFFSSEQCLASAGSAAVSMTHCTSVHLLPYDDWWWWGWLSQE